MPPEPNTSPLPTYADELTQAQPAALRLAALLAAPLVLAFSVLDRVLAPAEWLGLLVVRLAAVLVLVACAWLSAQRKMSFLPLAALGSGAIAATIEVAIFTTGGARSPYLYSMMGVQAGISILLPLLPLQAALLNAWILAIALGPLAVPPIPADAAGFAIAVWYLLTMAVISVAGAAAQDRMRRREHLARTELARHFGLLNLGTLAGGLAHELANPLNALGLHVEMLLRDPASAVWRTEKLRGNVERMGNILEAMRNGARLTSGERREVDLAREVELAYTLLEDRLRNRTAVVRSCADLPKVFCQPTLLGQVLVNLLVNAADAVATRSGARIWLRVKREGEEAVVEVEDNGPGVPEELRARIFQPFFSTKGDKGNGLGLWISSEIARVHGGTLSVSSGAEGGALFRMAFPIDSRAAPEPAPRSLAARGGH